jgi:uncharacterized protein YecT (DUF1311 family)
MWVEVYYEIRGEGVRPSGWFIRHLVGPDFAVRSEQIKALPAIGEPVPQYEVPDWAGSALAASSRQFEADYETARTKVRTDNDAARTEAIDRAKRIFSYRRVRLTALIEEQQAWIKERELSGSDRDRRILPARRGQVAKNRERLDRLNLEHEIELEEIQRRQPGASATVLAAGVVIGS